MEMLSSLVNPRNDKSYFPAFLCKFPATLRVLVTMKCLSAFQKAVKIQLFKGSPTTGGQHRPGLEGPVPLLHCWRDPDTASPGHCREGTICVTWPMGPSTDALRISQLLGGLLRSSISSSGSSRCMAMAEIPFWAPLAT